MAYKNRYRGKYEHRRGYSNKAGVYKGEPIVHNNETSLRWQKLLKYYLACISVENAGEVTLFSFKEGTEYLQIPCSNDKEWVISGKERLEFNEPSEKIQTFINGPRWSRSPLSYFYGFPCYVKHIEQSKKGWSGQIIQPILIFGVDLIQTETGYAFVLQSDRPRINSAFLTTGFPPHFREDRIKCGIILICYEKQGNKRCVKWDFFDELQ